MTRRYLKIVLVGSLFTLSACAQQSEVREMKQSVNTLNVAMDKLNKETVKITQQNALNAKSSNGVYLLQCKHARASEQPDWHAKDVSGECCSECRWYSRNITHSG